MNKKTLISWIAFVFIISGGLAFLIVRDNRSAYAAYDTAAFVQCLTEKKTVMYGAYWCSHCKNQKKMFGSAAGQIPYVECTKEEAKCTSAGIRGFPTWVFGDGTRNEGEMSLENLAVATGCELRRK